MAKKLRWRKVTWLVVVVNVAILVWTVVSIASTPASPTCTSLNQLGCQSAASVGTGTDILALFSAWVLIDVLLAAVWLILQASGQQICPACGNIVSRGMLVCKACGNDLLKRGFGH